MATLSLQNFTSLVNNMAAAVQSSAAALINLAPGSTLRAVLEANASVALWLQWLILQVLSATRLGTSIGQDADTWVADFGLTRLPGVASSGLVTFSRYSAGQGAFIPVGAQVKTADGTRVFMVAADSANPAWNGSNGFALPAGVASLTCTVSDVTPSPIGGASAIGAAGNVTAGTITLVATSMPGVDTVTNAAPFLNGINAESDAALQARFANYIQTLRRGTLPAIGAAIASVQQGLTWTISENVSASGAWTPGNFVVTVDDGTGSPPASLIAAVSAAIALYRPINSTWAVQAPSNILATISMTITTSPAANKPALLIPVENAILSYVNALPQGAMLPYSRLAMVAYMTDPSIADVTGVALNGGAADLVPGLSGVILATAASVTIN